MFLAACSKQGPTAPAQDHDEEEGVTAPAAPAEPAKPADYAMRAQGMMSLLADAPECQSYRDDLQAIVDAPAGTTPARDPAHVVAAAHDAGCSKKSRAQ